VVISWTVSGKQLYGTISRGAEGFPNAAVTYTSVPVLTGLPQRCGMVENKRGSKTLVNVLEGANG